MLQDKRKDLDSEKQKQLLQRLLEELSRTEPDFYYRSTSEVAALLQQRIDGGARLSAEEKTLLKRLSRRDIGMLLSLH
ncbi:hypothetical protein [Cribrihabitans pelagius]|uniref:hypothetical protein n=1 Tax=Cribrihabitans pelagius TaxID=1765746 RepID=UPI003B5CECD1